MTADTAGKGGPKGGRKPWRMDHLPFKDLEVLAVIVRHKSIGHIFIIYLESSSICKKNLPFGEFLLVKRAEILYTLGRSRYD